MPPHYEPEITKEFIDNFFNLPYVAFYAPYTGFDGKIYDDALIGIFMQRKSKRTFGEVLVFESLKEFKEHVFGSSKYLEFTYYTLLVPYYNLNFVKAFDTVFAELGKDAAVVGLITGGDETKESWPIITNQGIIYDGFVAIKAFNIDFEPLFYVNFQVIGPPFFFESEKPLFISRVDNNNINDFLKDLKKATPNLVKDYITAIPLKIDSAEFKRDFPTILRHPRRVIDE